LFAAMLDTGMNHGSACWDEGATTLSQAQEAKMAQICRKLKLQPGMRLLDIGCGWGSFLRYAAKHHGVQAVGLTHSPAQMQLGQSLSPNLPVQIELADYRQFNADGRSQFDVVVSLGMLSQAVQANDPAFFAAARRSLKKDGMLLLETIGNDQRGQLLEPWMEKHILGQAQLPSLSDVTDHAQQHFVVEDVHNLGAGHDRSLLHWHQRCELAWPQLRLAYDERFSRLWRSHLLASAGSFRARKLLTDKPATGAVWLARHGTSSNGHAGIVSAASGKSMSTIEANTSLDPTTSARDREGDWITTRVRSIGGTGSLKTMGFVTPQSILALLEA
jgi:cyclopropane-fatty-acyl-phospholipid synthase